MGSGRDFISGLFQKQCGGGYNLQYTYFSNLVARTMLLGLGFLLGTLALLEQVMTPIDMGCWAQWHLENFESLLHHQNAAMSFKVVCRDGVAIAKPLDKLK